MEEPALVAAKNGLPPRRICKSKDAVVGLVLGCADDSYALGQHHLVSYARVQIAAA